MDEEDDDQPLFFPNPDGACVCVCVCLQDTGGPFLRLWQTILVVFKQASKMLRLFNESLICAAALQRLINWNLIVWETSER